MTWALTVTHNTPGHGTGWTVSTCLYLGYCDLVPPRRNAGQPYYQALCVGAAIPGWIILFAFWGNPSKVKQASPTLPFSSPSIKPIKNLLRTYHVLDTLVGTWDTQMKRIMPVPEGTHISGWKVDSEHIIAKGNGSTCMEVLPRWGPVPGGLRRTAALKNREFSTWILNGEAQLFSRVIMEIAWRSRTFHAARRVGARTRKSCEFREAPQLRLCVKRRV